MSKSTFTTQAGVTISIQPVSPLLVDKVRSTVNFPEAPKYQERIELPGQNPIANLVPMRSRNDGKTEDEKRAWDNYLLELERANAEQSSKMFDAIVIPAVIPDLKLPDDRLWEKIHKHLGLTIPEDEFEKRVYYLKYELLKTSGDLGGLVAAIMRATGIDEEKVKLAEEAFRNSLR